MKVLFVLLFSLVVNFCNAQSHLKFMGIPITGTINTFQTKLQAKGFKHDKVTSSQYAVGIRAFKGKFAGEDADLVVRYDEKSYNVFRVMVCMSSYEENVAARIYNELEPLLIKKYGEYQDSEFNGEPSKNFIVKADDGESVIGEVVLTHISLYDDYGYAFYSIIVQYTDKDGLNIRDNSKLEDL